MRRDRLLRDALKSRYLVTLANGEAYDGLLITYDEAHLVLADCEQVAPSGERLRVDGQLWLPRPNVVYMQLPRI